MKKLKLIEDQKNKRLGVFIENSENGFLEFTNEYLTSGNLLISMINYVRLVRSICLYNGKEGLEMIDRINSFVIGPKEERCIDYVKKKTFYHLTDETDLEIIYWPKVINDGIKYFSDPNKKVKERLSYIVVDTDTKDVEVFLDYEKVPKEIFKTIGISENIPKKLNKYKQDINSLEKYILERSEYNWWITTSKNFKEKEIHQINEEDIDFPGGNYDLLYDIFPETGKHYIDLEYFNSLERY